MVSRLKSSQPKYDDCGEKRGTFQFSSKPRAVTGKYRDSKWACNTNPPAPPLHFGCMAFDSRIIRGNTFSRNLVPYDNSLPIDAIEVQRRRNAMKRAVEAKRKQIQERALYSPEPVEGRFHRRAQTELYLEELKDFAETVDVVCQTDIFLDKPPTPHYFPEKDGWDKETQIYEGDLFDFDIEVLPILEVLVGKISEQSLIEVAEEEELAALREQQRIFEELRNAEHDEEQRLEEQDRRRTEEKVRRMNQELNRLRDEKQMESKLAARYFSNSYLADLVYNVFSSLVDQTFFYDSIEKDVEHFFLPWLMDKVDKTMDSLEIPTQLVDLIIRDVVDFRFQVFLDISNSLVLLSRDRGEMQSDEEEEVENETEEEDDQIVQPQDQQQQQQQQTQTDAESDV